MFLFSCTKDLRIKTDLLLESSQESISSCYSDKLLFIF